MLLYRTYTDQISVVTVFPLRLYFIGMMQWAKSKNGKKKKNKNSNGAHRVFCQVIKLEGKFRPKTTRNCSEIFEIVAISQFTTHFMIIIFFTTIHTHVIWAYLQATRCQKNNRISICFSWKKSKEKNSTILTTLTQLKVNDWLRIKITGGSVLLKPI